ncbi:hypothetical protein V1511DRAFT_459159 [Dipodascopsis uninucleata]
MGNVKRKHILPSQRSKLREAKEDKRLTAKKQHQKRRRLDVPRSDKRYDSLAQKDEEDILYYAQKLGLKDGKLHKRVDDDDGLADLTDGLDFDFLDNIFSATKKKRKNHNNRTDSEEEDEIQDMENEEDVDLESDFVEDDENEVEIGIKADHASDDADDNDDDESFKGFREDDSNEDNYVLINSNDAKGKFESEVLIKSKENPYLPPVKFVSTGRYIPPSLRKRQHSETDDEIETLRKLRRQCQGQLNRLSEVNIASIVGELQQLFLSNPRQNVISTLTSLILEMTTQKATLLDNFVIVYGALTASLYKNIGTEFGASFVQSLVEEFEKFYTDPEKGKECSNLMVLLSQLYVFKVVGCNLVYDLIKKFLNDITELNTELLLKLIQNAGGQLRSDDPAALKDIISLLQKSVREMDQTKINSRTKFLIETVTSLKNNRLKQSSTTTQESIIRMRKYLSNNPKYAEPLRVSLNDILNVETKGKWWIVGAAWTGPGSDLKIRDAADVDVAAVNDILDSAEPDWLSLARQQRMNTDIRRAVFVAIMGSEDYIDATDRLTRLKLKRTQEREIPRVLLHCCASEKKFNPFYAYVGSNLCKQHPLKKTFQFTLWDYFKVLDSNMDKDNEKSDDSDHDADLDERFVPQDEDESASKRKRNNYSKFFALIVGEGYMGFDILKHINFLICSEEINLFLETFFSFLFHHISLRTVREKDRLAGEKALIQQIIKVKDNTVLVKGLEYFFKSRMKETVDSKSISKSCSSKERKKNALIKWGVDIMCDSIDRLWDAVDI